MHFRQSGDRALSGRCSSISENCGSGSEMEKELEKKSSRALRSRPGGTVDREHLCFFAQPIEHVNAALFGPFVGPLFEHSLIEDLPSGRRGSAEEGPKLARSHAELDVLKAAGGYGRRGLSEDGEAAGSQEKQKRKQSSPGSGLHGLLRWGRLHDTRMQTLPKCEPLSM